MCFVERDVDVGAFGYPQCVIAGVGQFAPNVAHLGRRLEVMLVTIETKTVLIAHKCTCLNTQQRIVCFVVTLVDIVRVVGGQQRRTNSSRNLHQFWIRETLISNSVILQFNKKIVFAEDLLQASCFLYCSLFVTIQQRLQHVSTKTTSGGDQAR